MNEMHHIGGVADGTAPLRGQTAVVTGGGRGIGRAVALRLARGGANVVVAARSRRELDAVCREVRSLGAEALAVEVDVTDDASVRELADSTTVRFGPADIVVNSAGIHCAGRFVDISIERWEECFDVNLFGTLRVIHAFLPDMLERDRGRIVNVASTAGKWASNLQSPYNASKHAVVGLTRCLGLETAGTGVRVNAVCPGFVDTEMATGLGEHFGQHLGVPADQVVDKLLERVPIGRLVLAEEVADVVWMLVATTAGAAIAGQALDVSGGLLFT